MVPFVARVGLRSGPGPGASPKQAQRGSEELQKEMPNRNSPSSRTVKGYQHKLRTAKTHTDQRRQAFTSSSLGMPPVQPANQPVQFTSRDSRPSAMAKLREVRAELGGKGAALTTNPTVTELWDRYPRGFNVTMRAARRNTAHHGPDEGHTVAPNATEWEFGVLRCNFPFRVARSPKVFSYNEKGRASGQVTHVVSTSGSDS